MRTEREQNRPSEPTSKAEIGERAPAARTRRAVRAPGTQRQTAQIINLMEALRRLLNEREAAAALEAANVQSALKELAQREIPVEPMIIEGELAAILTNDPSADDHEVAADVDAILKRLDQGIAAEHAAMDRLLERLVSRAPR
jgi:hypothetical protein